MNAKDFKKLDSPVKLRKWASIEPRKNLTQRKELHSFLCTDAKAKDRFLAICFLDPTLFFNLCLWTFNSQVKEKNIPFIPWPHQEPAILGIRDALEDGTDKFFDKSRKQGATYIILGTFLLYFLLVPDEKFLLGSRKESLVDDGSEIKHGMLLGSEEALFFKLLYMLHTLPLYLKPKLFKKHLFLQNMENGAAFRGDTTNIGFGKSFRSRACLIDEAAQIEPNPTQWIIENLADTCPTSIFNSTVGPWGAAHPYSKLMKQNPNKVLKLSFYDNPTQNYGLYDSQKEGQVTLYDTLYYKEKYPELFKFGRYVNS